MLQKIETLTDAEQTLVAAAKDMPVTESRSRALRAISENGLPNRRVEAWHYTDLRRLLSRIGKPVGDIASLSEEQWRELRGVLPSAARLPVLNGHFASDLADPLPAGIEIGGAPPRGFRDSTDAIAVMESLLGQGGLTIDISENARIGVPLELAHRAFEAGTFSVRHAVRAGAGAQLVVIETLENPDGHESDSILVTDLDIAAGASVEWVILQQCADADTHLAQLNVRMASDSELRLRIVNAGGRLVRREVNVVSQGEGSRLTIGGVNLVGGESHLDVTTSLVHEAPGTIASETFRNVAAGNGTGVFQGQISVARAAQKTDARMACNTLLLSDSAVFYAKPELEIFADDVQCAHGATVTDILDDHLFYLRARGIEEREARTLLVKAFVEEVFDDVDSDELRDTLNGRIEDWLDANG